MSNNELDTQQEWLESIKIETPFQRRDTERATPDQFSELEAGDWQNIVQGAKENRIPLKEVFDSIARKERISAGSDDWQTSQKILEYYTSRYIDVECKQPDAIRLHNEIGLAHIRNILKNGTLDAKLLVSVDWMAINGNQRQIEYDDFFNKLFGRLDSLSKPKS